MTESYSHMLNNMWAKEGTDISESLKKLQELEKIRKEREAQIQATRDRRTRNRINTDKTETRIQYSSRQPRSQTGSTEDLSVPNFGGARPKLASDWSSDTSSYRSRIAPRSRLGSGGSDSTYLDSFSSGYDNYGQPFSSYIGDRFTRSVSKPQEKTDDDNIFSNILDSVLKESREKRGQGGLRSDVRSNSTADSNTYTSGYQPSSWRQRRNMKSYNDADVDVTDYGQESNYDQHDSYDSQGVVGNEEPNADDGEYYETEEVYEINPDHEEEPYHFIERLKQGDQNGYSDSSHKRTAPTSNAFNQIPSIPPMKRARNSNGDEYVAESAESEEDIVALAKNIHSTFGLKSPRTPEGYSTDSKRDKFNFNDGHPIEDTDQNGDVVFSAKSSKSSPSKRSPMKRKSSQKLKDRKSLTGPKQGQGAADEEEQEEFTVYGIQNTYDSDEEEEPLEIDTRSSFYHKTAVEKMNVAQSPRKLNTMYEFFTGRDASDDPQITRVLNGSMVQAEMEENVDDGTNILAGVKDAFENLVDFSNDANDSDTPKEQRTTEIINKPVRKIKNGNKSSDSDNDSFQTASESESRSPRNRSPSQKKESKRTSKGTPKTSGRKTPDTRKSPLTIDDKLKKLETMTQEKTRKQSIGESDEKRPLPSYMNPTNASQKKTAKGKDGPLTDIAKDVRDIKKFVHENSSEPNSPVKVGSPTKQLRSSQKAEKMEIGTQTDGSNTDVTVIYVCKHCGKSSDEPVNKEAIELTNGNDKQIKALEQKEAKKKGYAEQVKTKVLKQENKTVPEKTKAVNKKSTEKLNEKNSSKSSSPDNLSDKLRSSSKESSPESTTSKSNWESKSDKNVPVHSRLYSKRKSPELKRSDSKESINSTSDGSVFDEKRGTKQKTTASGRGYMKGTTSSILKNSNGNNVNGEKTRKKSAPDIMKAMNEDSPMYSGKGLVAQRAKGFETFSKSNSQKTKTPAPRGKSADRLKADKNSRPSSPEMPISPRLMKSKSVDAAHWVKDNTFKVVESTDIDDANTTVILKDDEVKPSVINPTEATETTVDEAKLENTRALKKSAPPPISAKPKRNKVEEVKIVKSSETVNASTPIKTPPVSVKPAKKSDMLDIKTMSKSPKGSVEKPKPETKEDIENGAHVDSKGQFLTLGENPFIKNDARRRNSLKSNDGESIWEKESRSRDSSLKRSNSLEGKQPERGTSIRRSNTSVGERASLTQLSWSDSGSSGSISSPRVHKGESNMKKSGSKSSLHGSFTDLNKEGPPSPQKIRSGSVSSATSQTSQNSMLNLLNSPSSKRDVVTGAIETDIDAAYTEYVKSQHDSPVKGSVHDEESVERAHLEFAKQACDLLEFEVKKRDSSSDSQSNEPKKAALIVNSGTKPAVNTAEKNNNNYNVKENENIEKQGKKGKKSFLKGKLFKK